MTAMFCKFIVPTQRGLENVPADRQHFLAAWFHACFRVGNGSFLIRYFWPGVCQQMRQVGQTLPVDLPGHRLHDEFVHQEDPCWHRWCRQLLGQGRRDLGGPPVRCGGNHRGLVLRDRRCADESDQLLVLVVQHCGLDLLEPGLQDILDSLGLDTVPAHLEL